MLVHNCLYVYYVYIHNTYHSGFHFGYTHMELKLLKVLIQILPEKNGKPWWARTRTHRYN